VAVGAGAAGAAAAFRVVLIFMMACALRSSPSQSLSIEGGNLLPPERNGKSIAPLAPAFRVVGAGGLVLFVHYD
jgi:hypothetical protein